MFETIRNPYYSGILHPSLAQEKMYLLPLASKASAGKPVGCTTLGLGQIGFAKRRFLVSFLGDFPWFFFWWLLDITGNLIFWCEKIGSFVDQQNALNKISRPKNMNRIQLRTCPVRWIQYNCVSPCLGEKHKHLSPRAACWQSAQSANLIGICSRCLS